MAAKYESLEQGLAAAQIDRAQRHLFLCLGPDCADLSEGEQTWEHLKRQCKKLDLPVMRTKAGCFRICTNGPWLLIYPDGAWYGQVTPERLDRILREHVLKNRPITDWLTTINPLCSPEKP